MPEKLCVYCGQDCSNKPRVKDAQGRYACQACAQERSKTTAGPSVVVKTGAAAARANAGSPATPRPDFGEDDLDSIRATPMGSGPVISECTKCRTPMSAGQALCVNCGFNRHTGKAAPVAKSKKPPREPGHIATTLVSENPLLWAAVAVAGAAVGGGIWFTIMVSTGLQLSIFGLALGFTTGFPVLLIARSKAGLATGLTAGFVALAAVLVTSFFGYRQLAKDEFETEIVSKIRFTLEDAKVRHEFELAREWQEAGKLKWDTPDHPALDDVEGPDQLPKAVVAAADKDWESQSPEWREQTRAAVENQFKAYVREAGDEAAKQVAQQEMTEIHTRRLGGVLHNPKGMLLSMLWPYAMPILTAYFAYGFASGRFASA